MKLLTLAAAAATLATGLAVPAAAQRTVVHERTVVTHRTDYRPRHRTVCTVRYNHGHRVRTCRTVRY